MNRYLREGGNRENCELVDTHVRGYGGQCVARSLKGEWHMLKGIHRMA